MILFITDGVEKNGKGNVSAVNYQMLTDIFGAENVVPFALCPGHVKSQFDNSFYHFTSYTSKISAFANCLSINHPTSNKRIIAAILKAIKEHNIKKVFFDDSYWGNIQKKIRRKYPDVIFYTFFHNVRKILSRNWLKNKGITYLPVHIVTLINEKLTLKYSNKIIVLNDRESKNLYKSYQRLPDLILPITLKDHFHHIRDKNQNKPGKFFEMIFIGANYYPNVKGIRWFIDNVYKSLAIENKRLTIIGKGMEIYKADFEKENPEIKVKGTVPTLDKYYDLADVIISPIFEGAGMKVKTAEAFMFGKFIIGTKEAFEGYIISDNTGIECNDISAFKKALEKRALEKKPKFNKESRTYFLNHLAYDVNIRKFKTLF